MLSGWDTWWDSRALMPAPSAAGKGGEGGLRPRGLDEQGRGPGSPATAAVTEA